MIKLFPCIYSPVLIYERYKRKKIPQHGRYRLCEKHRQTCTLHTAEWCVANIEEISLQRKKTVWSTVINSHESIHLLYRLIVPVLILVSLLRSCSNEITLPILWMYSGFTDIMHIMHIMFLYYRSVTFICQLPGNELPGLKRMIWGSFASTYPDTAIPTVTMLLYFSAS